MLKYQTRLIAEPNKNCPWAEKMVLNPAIIKDPTDENKLHMLFRATGPCPEKQLSGKRLPYPIYLGYAFSCDSGKTWQWDYTKPAMAPALYYEQDKLYTIDIYGRRIINYSNGCIEDPRLFWFEKELFLSAACRIFPPGPYWEHDDPFQCLPDWVSEKKHGMGSAVTENNTVTLLFKVDLSKLANRDYDKAFALVTPLHNPNISDDRDVFLFPRKLSIKGKDKIICIHRPKQPWKYPGYENLTAPSIFLAAADKLSDFAENNVERHLLAVPEFEWEKNRIGASWAPLEIKSGEWLFPYHGKQNDEVGYTQSFMLLRENESSFPQIISRPKERLMYAQEDWELAGDFTIPCMFTCSGVIDKNNKLLMGYGAADQKIGIAELSFQDLIQYLKA